MISTVDRTDTELKLDVLAELKFEPSVKVTDIGVEVKDGVVTLTGIVPNYGEKWNAVRAAKRVAGVRAIADDIQVHVLDFLHRNDSDIATAAADRLDWNTSIPRGAVEISVSDGRITLEGRVEWWYQKEAAENAVQHLTGVKEVINKLRIEPTQTPSNIESDIKSAFWRNATINAKKVQVEAEGNRVTLQGKVRSYAERDEAERIAWAASGVNSVDNQIQVEWSWGLTD